MKEKFFFPLSFLVSSPPSPSRIFGFLERERKWSESRVRVGESKSWISISIVAYTLLSLDYTYDVDCIKQECALYLLL